MALICQNSFRRALLSSNYFYFLQIILLSFKGFCFPAIFFFLLSLNCFCFPSIFIQIFFFCFPANIFYAFLQIFFAFLQIFFCFFFKYFCFLLNISFAFLQRFSFPSHEIYLAFLQTFRSNKFFFLQKLWFLFQFFWLSSKDFYITSNFIVFL